MLTVDALLEEAGGADKAAAGCDVTVDATRKWRDAGAIPSRHWLWFAKATGRAVEQIAGAVKATPEGKAA